MSRAARALAGALLVAGLGVGGCSTPPGARLDGGRGRDGGDAGHRDGRGAADLRMGLPREASTREGLCMQPIAGGGSTVSVDSKGVACAVCPGMPAGRAFVPSLWGVVDCVTSCGACPTPATTVLDGGPYECVSATFTAPCAAGDEPMVTPSSGMSCATCAGSSGCVLPGDPAAAGPVYCAASCTACEPASSFGM